MFKYCKIDRRSLPTHATIQLTKAFSHYSITGSKSFADDDVL